MEKKLLIIDDNREIVDVVSLVLSDLFTSIDCAYTVEEAEEQLVKNVYSFIVLDINLDGRSGAEVIKFLAEDPSNLNNNAPFIIVSGIITSQFVKRNENRFAGILMKPFHHEDLRQKVEEILRNEKLGNEMLEVLPKISPPIINVKTVGTQEIPYLKCEYPFAIIQLDQRVNKILEKARLNPGLKQLFSQIARTDEKYNPERIGILINVSTAICLQLEWSTDKTLEKFVYAAFLYDIVLTNRSDLDNIDTVKRPTGVRRIEDVRGIPSDVAMIIRQYHEYKLDDSFQNIAQLSVVFIIAQDLTELILSNPKWNIENFIKNFQDKFKSPKFSQIFLSLSNFK